MWAKEVNGLTQLIKLTSLVEKIDRIWRAGLHFSTEIKGKIYSGFKLFSKIHVNKK